MNIKEWEVLSLNKQKVISIIEEYDLPDIVAMLLQVRGYEENVVQMMNSSIWESDPFEFVDMYKAVERINHAIDDFEKIAVYGDYDADGVTATAIVYSHLVSVGADVMYYIPERDGEGYGMNIPAVEQLHKEGVKLIITVDNGIASINEVKRANELGVDVVITDHHRVQNGVLPDAVAVVDPHREDCPSKFKGYAGAGVALKLVMALEWQSGMSEELFEHYCEIATIGTIGDVVPLVGENRTLVRCGLMSIWKSHRIGIQKLVEASGMKKISATSVAFGIVPRINAAGRMGNAEKALQILISEDEEDANMLCELICGENERRKTVESKILEELVELLDGDKEMENSRVIVVGGKNWHHGVLGIVSSRITSKYGKPSIVLSIDENEARGSGRSVEGFSLFDALNDSKDVLEKFGGHPMAAGLSLKPENIEVLRHKINEYAKNTFEEMPRAKVMLDCKLMPEALNVELVENLQMLEPFGTQNPTPLFGLYSMKLIKIIPLSGGKHLKLQFERNGIITECLKFSCTESDFPYLVNSVLDLAVTVDINEFRGAKNLSIQIKEMKISKLDNMESIHSYSVYENILRSEKLRDKEKELILPKREDFAQLYRKLKQNSKDFKSISELCAGLDGINFGKLLFMLDVMSERKLIKIKYISDEVVDIVLQNVTEKVDIFASKLFDNL